MGWLHVVFRVIYNSLYLFLSFILLVLVCVTPADSIRQALENDQHLHILTIIICASVTIVFVLFVYFVRLYIGRTALANIPKTWIPIGKGEAKKSVRKMIAAGLSRSAAIAYESRPRVAPARPSTAMTDRTADDREKRKRSILRMLGLKKVSTAEDKMGITLPPHNAVWGEIEHPGWASPNSPDLPNLQYSTVISELPNLIEAKALTLAPPAPGATAERPLLDPEAITLLQRPAHLPVRQYLARLAELRVLEASRTTADFLSAYEYARYSTRAVTNARGSSGMSISSVRGPRQRPVMTGRPRNSSQGTWGTFRTAPTTPKSRMTAASPTSTLVSPSSNFARVRQGYFPPSVGRGASMVSVSSSSSGSGSGSGGSVIRLSERADATGLPYVLTLAETRQ
ncbi:hypothetical protein VSDG_04187 [Cytospora chrysosperma]|uniref:Defect at low temperature protein 1 n=1 Tax=Cytospora chrysosperma TaxID=252740 RepID=A0A423W1F9_CYTCH|nr:hypothetical protein VSDG_04187 [Valsa sordida]